MRIRAIKLYDKYWSLITQEKPGRFGNVLWVQPNSGYTIGEEVYLAWSGGEELGNYKNIIHQSDLRDLNVKERENLHNILGLPFVH